MKDEMNWGYFLLAFIDILGQKQEFVGLQEMPETPADMEKLISALRQTVGFIEEFRDGFLNVFQAYNQPNSVTAQVSPTTVEEARKTSAKLRGFSDFMQIFSPLQTPTPFRTDMDDVRATLIASGIIFLLSLGRKHALRGAIDVGTGIEMEEGEIYGPVLNSAYNLESQIAQYPRILVGDELINFLRVQEYSPIDTKDCQRKAEVCLKMMTKDLDGLFILDYLGEGFREVWESIPSEKRGTAPLTLDQIIDNAFDFVKAEKIKWHDRKNSKLAFRYSLLHHYFTVRVPSHGKTDKQ